MKTLLLLSLILVLSFSSVFSREYPPKSFAGKIFCKWKWNDDCVCVLDPTSCVFRCTQSQSGEGLFGWFNCSDGWFEWIVYCGQQTQNGGCHSPGLLSGRNNYNNILNTIVLELQTVQTLGYSAFNISWLDTAYLNDYEEAVDSAIQFRLGLAGYNYNPVWNDTLNYPIEPGYLYKQTGTSFLAMTGAFPFSTDEPALFPNPVNTGVSSFSIDLLEQYIYVDAVSITRISDGFNVYSLANPSSQVLNLNLNLNIGYYSVTISSEFGTHVINFLVQ